MAIVTHVLGTPRIGVNRELKFALESYWAGTINKDQLELTGNRIRETTILMQKDLDLVTLGNFSFYDRVLDGALMFGIVPQRFRGLPELGDLDLSFAIARGYKNKDKTIGASPMKKWFNTNYHYIVPELDRETKPCLHTNHLTDEIKHARRIVPEKKLKVGLIGPLTLLHLAQVRDCNPLDFLEPLVELYGELLDELQSLDVSWVQLEEPILVLDNLDPLWKEGFTRAYKLLNEKSPEMNTLLTTYFESLDDNLPLARSLPVTGIHLDLTSDSIPNTKTLKELARSKTLSLGIIDGRNVWKDDLDKALGFLTALESNALEGSALESRGFEGGAPGIGDILIGSSCSLLHLPYSLKSEEQSIPPSLVQGLAFADEKIQELVLLGAAVNPGSPATPNGSTPKKPETIQAIEAHQLSRKLCQLELWRRDTLSPQIDSPPARDPYPKREAAQRKTLNLPLVPTTTIGSFPQTPDLRKLRRDRRNGRIQSAEYEDKIRGEIQRVIHIQEELGLDVLVHGEPERNDMVEYFTELLDGFVGTGNGWVQSFGSRCVKPAIICGPITRPRPMTLDTIGYAQSLSKKPVKGMLTGPVTMVKWSFPRKDISFQEQVFQVAQCLSQEVRDLESSGIKIIQIDEAAYKEAQPIRSGEWETYAQWAAESFRRTCGGVKNETQIHTHMCYSDFTSFLSGIADMDADVITIETSRSEMQLLDQFAKTPGFHQFGPGVWDIHSPVVPDEQTLERRLKQAIHILGPERVWANPDCGLKTRNWPEVLDSLKNLVSAAAKIRDSLGKT